MSPDACALVTFAIVVSIGVGGLIAAWLSVERDEREHRERVRRADSRIEEARRRVVASCDDISRARQARRQTLDRALAEARDASDSAMVSRDVPKIDTSRTKNR